MSGMPHFNEVAGMGYVPKSPALPCLAIPTMWSFVLILSQWKGEEGFTLPITRNKLAIWILLLKHLSTPSAEDCLPGPFTWIPYTK
jgi:hypothetical protein